MRPYVVVRPDGIPRLLFDSPHSGRSYPADWRTRCARAELRRGEDAYVDELIADAVEVGAVVLAATYPRCFIDVNRDEADIDPELLAEPWPGRLAPSEKSRRGLGLIRRDVVPGVPINVGPLSVAEIRDRILHVYRPYHAVLAELVAELRRVHGAVWHISWHSMKSVGNAMTPDGAGARRPDFVVSDRHGASAGPTLTRLIVTTLETMGYRVAVNDPYAGGTIVERFGEPADGVHSVQVEVNRALYLDELSVTRTDGFDVLRGRLRSLAAALAAAAPSRSSGGLAT